LACPVRRHEGQRGETAQRTRGGEPPVKEAGRQPGPRHRHAQVELGGKLLTPYRKRCAVKVLRDRFGVSERRACTVVGIHRSTMRLRPPPITTEEAELRVWLRRFSTDPPRWGWR